MRQTWRIMPLMTLLSVLLWCLYPLAPAKRLYELTRYALHQTLAKLSDERWIAWLCQDPDDPRSFPTFERWIDNLGSGIDLLIHLRACELLGLPNHDWTPPREAQLQPRRSRSFDDLWRKLELCVLKFGEIDRLAACRARKLERLYAAPPQTAEEIAIAAWRAAAATTATTLTLQAADPTRRQQQQQQQENNKATSARAGLRVRAPPWLATADYRLPIAPEAPASEAAPTCAIYKNEGPKAKGRRRIAPPAQIPVRRWLPSRSSAGGLRAGRVCGPVCARGARPRLFHEPCARRASRNGCGASSPGRDLRVASFS
jgi:hypothetical protein